MTYVEKWKTNSTIIENTINNNRRLSLSELASYLAISTNIPVLECCYILKEKFGESEELDKTIEILKKFYNVL